MFASHDLRAYMNFVQRFVGFICIRFEGFAMIWKYAFRNDYLP